MQAPLIDDFTRAPTICFHNDRPVRNLQGPPVGISPGWLQNPFSRTCTGPCEEMSHPSWHAWLITCVTYLSKYHTWPCVASWPCILKSLVSFAKASGHGTPCTSTASRGPRQQRFGQCEGASVELCQLRHWLSTNHTGDPLEAAKLCIDRLEPCNSSGAFRGINLWGWSSPQKVARRNPIWNTWTKKYQKKLNWELVRCVNP
jgi:hypothetical protein